MCDRTNFLSPRYQILMKDGGERKTKRNHLTQQKSGKQYLNNVIDTGKIEMRKNQRNCRNNEANKNYKKKLFFHFKKAFCKKNTKTMQYQK